MTDEEAWTEALKRAPKFAPKYLAALDEWLLNGPGTGEPTGILAYDPPLAMPNVTYPHRPESP